MNDKESGNRKTDYVTKTAIVCLCAAAAIFLTPILGASSGKSAYSFYCKFCHGGSEIGVMASLFRKKPKKLNLSKYDAEKLKQELGKKLKTWGKVKHFSANIANDSQFSAITEYITAKKGFSGKLLYMNSCQACHGESGDGGGIISGFQKNPLNFNEYAAEELKDKIQKSRTIDIKMGRNIPHIRSIPSSDTLNQILEYAKE